MKKKERDGTIAVIAFFVVIKAKIEGVVAFFVTSKQKIRR
jgi:hypothetical protein